MEAEYRKYLDPGFLAKVGSLDLRARMVVEGYVAGMHRSPYHGFSVEFAQHRPYTPGDEIKHLDWKVLARTDKTYLKQYEEETNLICMLLVDASESMSYASGPMSKYEYAVLVAASLAYLAIHQRDAVGLLLFEEGVRRILKASNSPAQWRNIVKELEGAVGQGRTDFRALCDGVAEHLRRRSLLVLISDLLMDLDEVVRGLRQLRHRKHEIMLLQVLDAEEVDFGFRGTTLFEGLEQGGRLLTDPRSLRTAYRKEVGRFTAGLRRACRELGVDYVQMLSSDRLDVVLAAFLAERASHIK